jgi:hypothetical protein
MKALILAALVAVGGITFVNAGPAECVVEEAAPVVAGYRWGMRGGAEIEPVGYRWGMRAGG